MLVLRGFVCYNGRKRKAVHVMGYFVAAIGAYLLGCSNPAFYLSKLYHVEVRDKGSGNLGASNTTLIFGWWAGILVAAHDIGKAALAVILANLLFPQSEYVGVVAGVACVLGHIFPFYLGFKGGKGFASFWGMTLALNWKLALVLAVAIVLITLITDYIVLATATTVITVPIYLGITSHGLVLPLIILVATLTILWKHRKNFVRIVRGEEIGLRSAAKGEHRVS